VVWLAGLLCAAGLALGAPSVAEVAAGPSGEQASAPRTRADIVARQRTLKAEFDEEERACRQRFVVTACVDDVRTRRRAALAPLRDAELRLEEAERRQQAEVRRAAVAEKQRAQAERGPEPAPARAASAAAPQPRSPWRVPSIAARSDEAASAAAARAQASQRRQAQAEAAQARIAKRQAEQAKKGQAAAPLPAPEAASAARR
jgi:colicin import membrane protein